MDLNTINISVVICTYNGEKYLSAQIESVLRQSYPISEIIIQDDCSTDSTWSIIETYQRMHPSLIKCFQNEHNLFWNQNFYSAMKKSSGDFIALCDQDDVWHPQKIEKQIAHIKDKMICVCCSNYWSEGVFTPMKKVETSFQTYLFYPQYSGHEMLLNKRAKEFVSVGQQIDMAHDIFFSLIGLYTSDIVILEETLVDWRRHPTSATGYAVDDKHAMVDGKGKVLACVQSLANRHISPVIKSGCEKYYQLFCYLKQFVGEQDGIDWAIAMAKLLKKQTILAYLSAGFLIWKNRTLFFRVKSSFIKQIYSSFTFPFRWWYDHQFSL